MIKDRVRETSRLLVIGGSRLGTAVKANRVVRSVARDLGVGGYVVAETKRADRVHAILNNTR
jgi:hypothetical protein